MENFYARAVFFVKQAEASLAFYTERLGFKLDWNYQEDGRTYVFQVSLFGFELIVNQVGEQTQARAGHGRVFIGLEPDQWKPLRDHLDERGIQPTSLEWGAPTLALYDLDQNEIYFWPPRPVQS